MSRRDDALNETFPLSAGGEEIRTTRLGFRAGWDAAVESDEVSTPEELDKLPAGTMVFWLGYYDGYWPAVAVKSKDGNWYDAYDPMADVVPQLHPEKMLPVKIVHRPEEDKWSI